MLSTSVWGGGAGDPWGVHPSLQVLMIKFLIWGSFYIVAGGRSMMGMLVVLLRDKCLYVFYVLYMLLYQGVVMCFV